MDQLYRDIDTYHRDLERMRWEINEKQSQMAGENNPDRRRDLLARIQQLQNDVNYTQNKLYSAERERDLPRHITAKWNSVCAASVTPSHSRTERSICTNCAPPTFFIHRIYLITRQHLWSSLPFYGFYFACGCAFG